MDIPDDTAISILVIYHRKSCICLQEDIYSTMFVTALFITEIKLEII